MSTVPAGPIALALRIEDGALADRLTALLAGVAGIRIVAEGDAEVVVSAATADTDTLAEPVAQILTPREREVVALLAEGLSNKEIAIRLGIAPDTAKFHVARVIDKLDATGRTDAVAHAARRGVIHL
jgi:DNA-binding CsgD family transcriptional regulator